MSCCASTSAHGKSYGSETQRHADFVIAMQQWMSLVGSRSIARRHIPSGAKIGSGLERKVCFGGEPVAVRFEQVIL